MSTVWGPYWETYNSKTGQYFLFKSPNPNPIKQSHVPLLKESVSILLNELLKPRKIQGTPVSGLDRGSNETPDESVIKPTIATMSEEVVRKVKAASDNREALAILALNEDLRFGDLSDCE